MRSNNRVVLFLRPSLIISVCTTSLAFVLDAPNVFAADEALKVLFLGGADGSHRPCRTFRRVRAGDGERGIAVSYTDEMSDINAENLAKYAALVVYANIDRIEPAEEQALLDYVAGGGGFVPIHCASYCFRNSPKLVALIGAQFQRHGWERCATRWRKPIIPSMKGYGGFESLDETYVHHRHNEKDRIVLAYRVDGDEREPWTWVRTHGKGRVFYTAWGHDQRTWGNPGFQNLVERGIRWAAGKDPADAGPFTVMRQATCRSSRRR